MFPNFLIIGAPRSGTTHLYRGLRQHPSVFMSDFKEPMFFAYENRPRKGAVSDLLEYQALFDGASGYSAAGEASTLYLYSERAPEAIGRHIPEARLIAILRNPADRAFSQYTFQRFLKTEPLDSFEEALAAESQRQKDPTVSPFFLYRRVGHSGELIPRFVARFSPSQFLFLLHDDLDSVPQKPFRQIFAFIGVDPSFVPDLRHKTNTSGVAEHGALFSLVKSVGRRIKKILPERLSTELSGTAHQALLTRPSMNPDTRRQLIEEFSEDIQKTGELIGRDLSHWLR